MTRPVYLLVGLLWVCSLGAQEWLSDPGASSLGFSSAVDGNPFRGEFEDFAVRMTFDPEQPSTTRLAVTVETSSVNTGSGDRDDVLRGDEWFAVEAYPVARYIAMDLSEGRSRAYRLAGDLTIKGTTCPVAIEFDWRLDDEKLTISGTALMTGDTVVTRTDFALGTGDWADTQAIAADVPVIFEVVLQQTAD